MTNDTRESMTVEEVAMRLRVDPRTVYRLIHKKRIHAVRVGRLWRVPSAAYAEYLRREPEIAKG